MFRNLVTSAASFLTYKIAMPVVMMADLLYGPRPANYGAAGPARQPARLGNAVRH